MPEFLLIVFHIPLVLFAVSYVYRIRAYLAVRPSRVVTRIGDVSDGDEVLIEGDVEVEEEDAVECPPTSERCLYYHWVVRREVANHQFSGRTHIETSYDSRQARVFRLTDESGSIQVYTSAADFIPLKRSAATTAPRDLNILSFVPAFRPGEAISCIASEARVKVAGQVREMNGALQIRSTIETPAVITDATGAQLRGSHLMPAVMVLVMVGIASTVLIYGYVHEGRDAFAESFVDLQNRRKYDPIRAQQTNGR